MNQPSSPSFVPLSSIETPKTRALRFLPINRQEMSYRGWDELDVLLINGDAYVDHPTFGIPAIGRYLEKMGFRVGILPQPRWDNLDDILSMGRPRLFVGISAGTVDSMINNYTANKKPRSDDQYSAGGKGGNRPDYATEVYSKLARRAFPDTPLFAGGVEVSLRRLAHFDYWQNKVRPSVLMDLEVELMVFGMGERQIKRIIEEFSHVEKQTGQPLSRQYENLKKTNGRRESYVSPLKANQ